MDGWMSGWIDWMDGCVGGSWMFMLVYVVCGSCCFISRFIGSGWFVSHFRQMDGSIGWIDWMDGWMSGWLMDV
jgi:hypothetical protein